jgi:hypothetical protein
LKSSKALVMKSIHLLLACSVIAFSSCSTYKNTQTPDDIYYSSGNSSASTASSSTGNSDYYAAAPSDQYVQMKAQDQARWSYFDDYSDYPYTPTGFGSYYDMGAYGYGFGAPWLTFGYWSPNTFWNSYYAWNSFYNPYYGSVVVVNPKVPSSGLYTPLRPFSQASYTNGRNAGGVARTSLSPYSQPSRFTGNNSNGSRRFYNAPGNDSYRPSLSQPVRSYSPSSFGGSGSGGGGMRSGGGIGRSGRG